MAQPEQSLLSFMIGGVQPFIASARTLRDLWSGSYLLSWLTAAAMQPVIDKCDYEAFITPHVDGDNPLLAAMRGETRGDRNATLPSLPNKFAAIVPSELAETLRSECVAAAKQEWRNVSQHVRRALSDMQSDLKLPDGLDLNWDQQLDDYFEIRCVATALAANSDDTTIWGDEWNRLGALLEMSRSVGHVPRYVPRHSGDGRFPAKCSLLGTLEQMGPAGLAESAEYWKRLCSKGLHGTRLQKVDRLCAVSLVKRFAWPAYFSGPNGGSGSRLGCDVQTLRFSDTSTIAANLWLAAGKPLVPYDKQLKRWIRDEWNGQWLHWTEPVSDEGERCPKSTWDEIEAKRRAQGTPPTYYAILHMDGDNMGLLFQGQESNGWGQGKDRYREITRRLTEYSLRHVEGIVEKHSGELIYAGGDDVLAILPTATAIACANELRKAFSLPDTLGKEASASAGIAVVHYKEDLRFALEVARRAEKAAKQIYRGETKSGPPRKDALAITVCRHSGEHSTGVMGWEQSVQLCGLVEDYRKATPPSDRWSYKLRDELPVLQGLPPVAIQSELTRLLKRTESSVEGFRERILGRNGDSQRPPADGLFKDYQREMTTPDRAWTAGDALDGFTTICQTASFLARGRE